MSWIIWTISLGGLVVIAMFALRRFSPADVSGSVHLTAGDLLRDEIDTLVTVSVRILDRIRPLVMRSASKTYMITKAIIGMLYGRFHDRIYGKHEIEQGKTVSFFLKRIRQFKEELTRDDIR
jgi:hypothetical protein